MTNAPGSFAGSSAGSAGSSAGSDRLPLFDKVLVANRGEIACRIMRTCHDLGIRTVAVYSEADATAAHVRLAHEAVCIGPAPSAQSYLRIEAIVDAAKSTGAQAIHPGYGFLSENAAFATACAEAGIVFVGPPGAAIDAMGEKTRARARMTAAGVPVVPGTEALDESNVVAAAERVGFPVMLKAASGGGGKGMRIVQRKEDVLDAFRGARRTAASAFGDDRVYIEKYVVRPRHIEIQFLADAHGNAIYLFERECSVQRRHQKIVEEAPASTLSQSTREQMGGIAVKAALAIGYQNAGTCEFIVDQAENFYFLEMNTRLQVEHPVTEWVTGVDLVAEQLHIAAGHPLRLRQADLTLRGHAVECRLYAEDPYQNGLPSPGTLRRYRPPEGPGVRVDAGVYEGAEVPQFYDPMIAKLAVWGPDRASAIERCKRALSEFQLGGIRTNIVALQAILAAEAFATGHYDTGVLEGVSLPPLFDDEAQQRVMAAVAAVVADRRAHRAAAAPLASRAGDPGSAWRMSGRRAQMNGGQ